MPRVLTLQCTIVHYKVLLCTALLSCALYCRVAHEPWSMWIILIGSLTLHCTIVHYKVLLCTVLLSCALLGAINRTKGRPHFVGNHSQVYYASRGLVCSLPHHFHLLLTMRLFQVCVACSTVVQNVHAPLIFAGNKLLCCSSSYLYIYANFTFLRYQSVNYLVGQSVQLVMR